MACSGINEHHEARRRQNQAERKALIKMMLLKGRDSDGLDACQLPPQSSYEAEVTHLRKLGSPPGMTGVGHDPLSTDRQRREEFRQQQLVDYSAKLPKRFNSIDYKSQW